MTAGGPEAPPEAGLGRCWRIAGWAAWAAISALTAIPFIAKHAPGSAAAERPVLLAAYLALAAGLPWLAWRRQNGGMPAWIPGPGVALPGAAALALAAGLLYPATRHVAHPSSAPDALILPAQQLWAGAYPYAAALFDGAPISPGPGWIMLLAPLTLAGLVWLVTPLAFGAATGALSRFGSRAAWRFTALMATSLAFLQMVAIGHDLYALPLVMLALALAAHDGRDRPGRLALLAVIAGVVATARLPLLLFPLLLALLIGRDDGPAGRRFAAIALGVTLALQAAAAGWGAMRGLPYPPLHVIGRAAAHLPPWAGAAGAALAMGLAWRGWRHLPQGPAGWLLTLWLGLAPPFAAIGLAELIGGANGSIWQAASWALWEGKIYLGFTQSLLAGALVLGTPERGGIGGA